MSEKKLKELGEKLAKAAAKADVGAKQLRELFKISKTRPIPFLEAYVKRQISRAKSEGGPGGFAKFGPEVLEVMELLEENKERLQKVLKYANMLYGYEKTKLEEEIIGGGGWREKLGPIVEEACARYGYVGLKLEPERGRMLCRVMLRRFRGNPRQLSEELYQRVISHFPDLTGGIRFWIE